jgi:hypothetical protein
MNVRCLYLEKDQEEMECVLLCLLVTLDTCKEQYNYNHAWYTLENCGQENYGVWEMGSLVPHDKLHLY